MMSFLVKNIFDDGVELRPGIRKGSEAFLPSKLHAGEALFVNEGA
jgi:hypothetical protein